VKITKEKMMFLERVLGTWLVPFQKHHFDLGFDLM